MKRLIIPLLTVALLALSTGCVDQIENNPNFNPETKEVKTQFVFNISNISNPETKQTLGATQAASTATFRGIDSVVILTVASTGEDGKIFIKDKDMDKKYELSDLISSGALNADKSHRILEMSLPLLTNQVLFYGRAHKGNPDVSGLNADECFGKLDRYYITTEKGSADFCLAKRLTDDEGFSRMTRYLSATLSTIMHTNIKLSNNGAIAADSYPEGLDGEDALGNTGYPYKKSVSTYPDITWKDYASALTTKKSPFNNTIAIAPLEEKLGDLYSQMTSIRTSEGELRAASGEAILRIVRDLWTIVNEVRCSDPTSEAEAVAKFFAEQINQCIKQYYSLTLYNNGTTGGNATFKAFSAGTETINSLLTSFSWMNESDRLSSEELNTLASSSSKFKDFPTMFALPRGGTHMTFDKTKEIFLYPSTFNTSGMGTSYVSDNKFNEHSYYYPAELLYFGNSPIRTSDIVKKEADYPNGSGVSDGTATYTTENPRPWRWEDDGNPKWADFNGQHVTSTTRSVAVKYDINYGVALLETKVQYGSTTLKDNRHAIQKYLKPTLPDTEELDKEITPDASTFKLTGIIIGGQSRHVGWDYLPRKVTYTRIGETEPTTNYEEGFIFDQAITETQSTIPATGTSTPVYTCVFDNYIGEENSDGFRTGTNDEQLQVHVALEFQNNGEDFFGNYNLIRNGGYFYLIGVLKLKEGDTVLHSMGDGQWHSDGYITPPYKSDYLQSKISRVFIQDYKTSATFTIGENSLKNAYLTVPDLRSNSLSFGLSVDLNWETGIDFGTVVL